MYALAEMIDMKCLVDARNCFLRCTLVEILRAWSRNNLVLIQGRHTKGNLQQDVQGPTHLNLICFAV